MWSEQIQDTFGHSIAELVGWLTDVSKPEDGNRATRKAMDCYHLGQAPADAQTIKLADLISNSKSIAAHDPAFARVYMVEKRNMLEVLTQGNDYLYAEAKQIMDAYFKENPQSE